MKILLIQFGAIGDILMCTPAIRALRKNFPNAEITFLIAKSTLDSLKHNPNIDKFIVLDFKISALKYIGFLLKFVYSKYDVVIDFQRNPRTAIITWLSHAKKRISFLNKHRNYAYNYKPFKVDKFLYSPINKLKLLEPLKISEENDFLPELFITENEEEYATKVLNNLNIKKDDFVVALSPVSVRQYRRWSSKNFAEICDFLIDKHKAKLIFTWGPNELYYIEEILSLMKNKPKIDYSINDSSILDLKAIYKKCDLFVGNDNGPRHIAITADIPTIGIFSNTFAPHWTPPNSTKHIPVIPPKHGIIYLETHQVKDAINNILSNLKLKEK